NAVPLLRPHVAEEMSRDRRLLRDLVFAVFGAELLPRVAVKVVVERLDVLPEAFDVHLERLRAHVVTGAPKRAHVREADFLRALVPELRVPRVPVLHHGSDGVPSLPRFEELVVVPALLDDAREVIELERSGPAGLRARGLGRRRLRGG